MIQVKGRPCTELQLPRVLVRVGVSCSHEYSNLKLFSNIFLKKPPEIGKTLKKCRNKCIDYKRAGKYRCHRGINPLLLHPDIITLIFKKYLIKV